MNPVIDRTCVSGKLLMAAVACGMALLVRVDLFAFANASIDTEAFQRPSHLAVRGDGKHCTVFMAQALLDVQPPRSTPYEAFC